ncbi:hypothetical protein GGR54DRAFT_586309 [Hypoxylon sp. NC1633]|nr:hypothetical protein GGR54DRAFT_586309 [Hypoxylon sp. NC1633]
MLSSMGRIATKRLVLTATTPSFYRIAACALVANPLQSGRIIVRSYATPGRPKSSTNTRRTTKTTATKTAAKKPKKKPTAKKPAKKSRKAKTVKSKAVAKPKARRRKQLTPEKLAIVERRELRKAALFTEPKELPAHPWILFVSEQTKGTARGAADLRSRMSNLSQSFKQLPASELQRLTVACEQNKLANAAAYKTWVEGHTPQEINRAIKARLLLKRKYGLPQGDPKPIRDDRLPKKAVNAFSLFTKARWASGDHAGKGFLEGSKAIGQEWKQLPDTERYAYQDLAKANFDQYAKEVESVLHRPVYKRPTKV